MRDLIQAHGVGALNLYRFAYKNARPDLFFCNVAFKATSFNQLSVAMSRHEFA
jgi:hypothetical protein